MNAKFEWRGIFSEVQIDRSADRITIRRGKRTTLFTYVATPTGFCLSDGVSTFDTTLASQNGDNREIFVNGIAVAMGWIDSRRTKRAKSASSGSQNGEVRSVMPGRVSRVCVHVGDQIALGDPLVVLEAMKMENEIKSTLDGIVESISVAQGNSVESNALLMKLTISDETKHG